MSRPVKIVCDGCGKQKQQTNRWWQGAMDLRDPRVQCIGRVALRIAVFDATESQSNLEWAGWTWYDFCGVECALKFISEQMGRHGEET